MIVQPYGDRGVLLASLNAQQRSCLLHSLTRHLPEHCQEYVVGYDSLLLIGICVDSAQVWAEHCLAKHLSAAEGAPSLPPGARSYTVPVDYNGEDLEAIADACRLTVAEVVELHCQSIYSVHMLGFSPGFPYLQGLDPRLHLDRRRSPRNRIEPGSVAIGGPHAGIYTVASPGGWHILGHTDFQLFDLATARAVRPCAREVFSLSPGDQVRFQPKGRL
ncbi:allophanate hydrolase subunit 1 [Coraliomargarita sp. SDUM461004]|uniref:Allophanate hydrolase subunit 1 n=1 Tax=Thalassobacterium sedimentorum TaxID=3041258 RepID=A0ABU1AI25_9BACT|nr:allophanate hydrolase subunit 1 [Coraliomargarita sp. SDUM461004]MDQ8193833.1 allophanate hydrolase subunit 1 [Coraliomargarita sp. SDUM461004]